VDRAGPPLRDLGRPPTAAEHAAAATALRTLHRHQVIRNSTKQGRSCKQACVSSFKCKLLPSDAGAGAGRACALQHFTCGKC